jgi:hypothetical protein
VIGITARPTFDPALPDMLELTREMHGRAFASCRRRVQLHAEDALRPGTEVGKDGT